MFFLGWGSGLRASSFWSESGQPVCDKWHTERFLAALTIGYIYIYFFFGGGCMNTVVYCSHKETVFNY